MTARSFSEKPGSAENGTGRGMRIYLVGGAVRDELLGCRPPDRDYVVFGATEEAFRKAYPGAKKVGRQGRSVFIHRGREFTLSEQPDIWADLRRRDLTVNAAAKDERGRILATEQTRLDLQNRVLRPVHPDNFRDDPLRCYRAARMAACFPDFTLHAELVAVLRDMGGSPELDRIAAERVCGEVRKACGCPAPGRFLRTVADHDLFASWLRELAPLREKQAVSSSLSGIHGLSDACGFLDRLRGDALRVWMGLCACLVSVAPRKESATWNPRAADLARDMARRLRMPLTFIRAGERAAGWIQAAAGHSRLAPETRVDLLTDLAAHDLNEQMLALAMPLSPDVDPEVWRGDLQRVLQVRLPEDKQGLGPESGRILRQMRCESLRRS